MYIRTQRALDVGVSVPTTTSRGTGKFADDASFKLYAPIGSTCIVGNGTNEVLVYMLFSNGWKQM